MRFITIAILSLLCALPAFSQGEKISFRTLALFDTKFPPLWVMESARPVALSFPSSQPSIATRADRLSPFRIFKGELDEKGLPIDPAPSAVTLPAASSILLLGWMNGEVPGFMAIEDPFATMRRDDWLVINTSKKLVAIQIGDTATPEPVKPNSHRSIRCNVPTGTGAAVTVATQQNGAWVADYSSYWPIYDDKRGLILIVQKGERLLVSYIADQIAPKP